VGATEGTVKGPVSVCPVRPSPPPQLLLTIPRSRRSKPPIAKLRDFVQNELGDLTHLSAAMGLHNESTPVDSGDETETDVRLSPRRTVRELDAENVEPPPAQYQGVSFVYLLCRFTDIMQAASRTAIVLAVSLSLACPERRMGLCVLARPGEQIFRTRPSTQLPPPFV
jgi:hypothetical protein